MNLVMSMHPSMTVSVIIRVTGDFPICHLPSASPSPLIHQVLKTPVQTPYHVVRSGAGRAE